MTPHFGHGEKNGNESGEEWGLGRPARRNPERPPPAATQIPKSKSQHAFTLAEMLASMTVLVLLAVLAAQLTHDAAAITTGCRRRMDADAEARLVFDCMANDFAGMVMRADVDVICKGVRTNSGFISMTGGGAGNGGGNDAMYFFSQAPAYYENQNLDSGDRSNVALIGYRINPGTWQLERLGKGLTRDGMPGASGATNGMVFLPSDAGASRVSNSLYGGGSVGYLSCYTAGDNAATIGTFGSNGEFNNSTDPDYHSLGESVYRFEYCFLLKSYTDSRGSIQPAQYACVPYHSNLNHHSVSGWRDVAAIVVAIALLDPESRKAVSDMSGLAGALYDAEQGIPSGPMGLVEPGQAWSREVMGWDIQDQPMDFATVSGIPPAAAGRVRIYQRVFYLNH
jgi:prepilin-type N-terminal cleavage/methylation domain-containing protein